MANEINFSNKNLLNSDALAESALGDDVAVGLLPLRLHHAHLVEVSHTTSGE